MFSPPENTLDWSVPNWPIEISGRDVQKTADGLGVATKTTGENEPPVWYN